MIVHEHGVDPLESEDSFKFCGSPLSIDVEKEEINLYGVISTSIFASNILSHSGKSDADGPTTDSTGIDAASLKDSSLGSEILETLPSSADRLGHNSLQDHPQPSGGGGVGGVAAASHLGERGCRVADHGDQDGGQHQG